MSMELDRVDDATTQVLEIQHLDATNSGTDTISQYFDDQYKSVVARVHGDPLPEY